MSNAPLGHDEVQELLGAYALDAVDADEAALVEDHLRDCPRCRAELAAHRETAAQLSHGHAEPPPQLWDRVAAALEGGTPAPPLDLSTLRERHARRRGPARWTGIAAAAMVAAFLGLATVTVQQQRELDRVQAALDEGGLASAALAAFDDPAARHATLEGGGSEVRAVVLPDGSGYVLAGGLPALAPGRTYQLWAMVDGAPVSAGVLGNRPTVTAFHVTPDTAALAISIERGGGASVPTMPPRVVGTLA